MVEKLSESTETSHDGEMLKIIRIGIKSDLSIKT